jgi:Flp pilus assembly protein TadG
MRSQNGQAIVELALCLMILLLLAFSIVDFGRVFHAYLALDHAGREGARVASIGGTDSEVIQAAQNAAAGLDTNVLAVTVSPAERTRGTYATVALTYDIEIITPIMAVFFPSNPFPIQKESVMRVE